MSTRERDAARAQAGAGLIAASGSTKSLRRLAWLLDDVIRIPGTNLRFGLDPLIGLVPVGGDLAGGALSTWIIVAASRLGAPPAVLARMAGNVLVDALLGAVPFLGDLFDAGWKANRRNVTLLQHYVDQPGEVRRSSRIVVALIVIVLILVIGTAAWLSYSILRWLFGLL